MIGLRVTSVLRRVGWWCCLSRLGSECTGEFPKMTDGVRGGFVAGESVNTK